MARKTLENFEYDFQTFADYLESAECANDEGYDTFVDAQGGKIYIRLLIGLKDIVIRMFLITMNVQKRIPEDKEENGKIDGNEASHKR